MGLDNFRNMSSSSDESDAVVVEPNSKHRPGRYVCAPPPNDESAESENMDDDDVEGQSSSSNEDQPDDPERVFLFGNHNLQ